jgi:hypothetical protein
MNDTKDDSYSDKEIAERMERGLKRSFNMPHKPHTPSKAKASRRRKAGASKRPSRPQNRDE